MRIALIHNKHAGEGEPGEAELLAALREAGYHPVSWSGSAGDIEAALADPGELVVIAGGDGTVASVVKRAAGRGITLAVIPIGTANNIGASLGIHGSWREQIAGWPAGARREFDVGVVSGRPGTIPFAESVGCGLLAELIHRFEDENGVEPLGPDHELQLARRKLRALLKEAVPRRVRVVLDGRDFSGDYLLAEAMNIGRIGPGVVLSPDADWGDGMLDVVLLTEESRTAAEDALCSFQSHAHARLPPSLIRKARRVVFEPGDYLVHVDDEVVPDAKRPAALVGPLQLRLEPRAVTFLVPPGADVSPVPPLKA